VQRKKSQKELKKARVLYSLRKSNESSDLLFWAISLELSSKEDSSIKSNEVVFSGMDTASLLMYKKNETLENSEVVLVKNFRSSVSNADGYLYELPGTYFLTQPVEVAQLISNVSAQTGFSPEKSKISTSNVRKMMSSFSAHQGILHFLELPEEDLKKINEETGKNFVVLSVSSLLEKNLVDWSILGMILSSMISLFKDTKKKNRTNN